MRKITISEEEMMKYPGEDKAETCFLMKAVMEGKRSEATVYFDEAFIEFDTSSGRDSISLKNIIDFLKRRIIKKTDKRSSKRRKLNYAGIMTVNPAYNQINKKYIEELLKDIVRLKGHCEKRCLEKMNASKKGFGKNNDVESISFNENDVSITVVDSGYDLRDIAFESINIDEICMADEEWNDHLLNLKQEIENKKELKKKKIEKKKEKEGI